MSAAPWKLESIWTKGQNYATKENVENVRRKTRDTKLKEPFKENTDLEKGSSMTPCLLGIMVTKSVDEAVRIERTSKLGSMRETIDLMKKVTGESLNYQRALMKESTRFFLNSIRKGMKVAKLVKECRKKGEGLLASPDIAYRGKKYWVLRYGPQPYKVSPLHNFPTGYTVFTHEHNVLRNVEQCSEICKFYRVWEEFYFRPFKMLRGKTMLLWATTVKKKIFDSISERRLRGYDELEGSDEEKQVLKELDDEVYTFYETDAELMKLEERLFDLQFHIFEHPSDENIADLVQLTHRFQELLPIQEQYVRRRLTAWQKYRHLLERKYEVSVNLDFEMTDIGIAAFIDLMKYVLFKRIIPEAVLSKVAWDVTKSIGEAKIAQLILNLLVHYGGLKSLKAQTLSHANLKKNLDNYIEIWRTEIPLEMIRLP